MTREAMESLLSEGIKKCSSTDKICKFYVKNSCVLDTSEFHACIKTRQKNPIPCFHRWSEWKPTKRGSKRKYFRRCEKCGSMQHQM
jgi:tRNA G10  N-methylase Trm11